MPWNKHLTKFAGRAVASFGRQGHVATMVKRSPLDDPRVSAHAWARYKRLMKGMAAFTLAVVVVALGAFYWFNGLVSVHFFIATALGIGFAMMLMAALMGLVFLSSGTGHDEAVSDLEADDQATERSADGRSR
jgi:hypothetical protein